jgi:O-antigen/teichoic acid export membrane protein
VRPVGIHENVLSFRTPVEEAGVGSVARIVRTSAVLTASSLVTVVMGTASWAAATRVLSPVDLGSGSALLSACILWSGIAQGGLNFGLLRYSPEYRRDLPNFINGIQTRLVILAATASGLLWLVPPLIRNDLSPAVSGLLGVATLAWALFTFGEPILLLLGADRAVLLRTVAVSTVRLLVVIVGAATLGSVTFVIALALAGAVGTIATNAVLIPRALPGYRPEFRLRMPSIGRLWRYSLGTYFAALVSGSPLLLIPLFVNHLAGSVVNAHLAVAWVIASLVSLTPSALSIALLVHASRAGRVNWTQTRYGVLIAAAMSIAAAVSFPLWRTPAFAVLGPTYQEGSETAVLLLTLSGVPLAINASLTAVLRAFGRVRDLIAISFVTAAGVLALTAVLVPSGGVTGAAWSWLMGQSAGSIAFLVTLGWMRLRRMTDPSGQLWP